MNLNPDVVVIGAGPAGSMAAAHLVRAGFEVVVVEKSRFPRFVIGESLLPQCMDLLEEAGMLEAVQARGYQRKEGGLFRYEGEVAAFDFSQQFSDGWAYTYQVPRDDFDQVLAKEAEKMGAEFHFGVGVSDVRFEEGDVDVMLEGGAEVLRASFVLDASGAGRVLPRLLNLSEPTRLRNRRSMFSHVRGDRGDPLTGKKKIVVSIHPENRGVWYWMIPFSSGVTSVGVVAESAFFEEQPEEAEALFRAVLAQECNVGGRMKEVELLYPPRVVSGYSQAVTHLFGDRFALLGNSGAFLDPVFSSGVAIAMKSASLASKVLIAQLRGEAVDWKVSYEEELMRGVKVFETYVRGWYDGTFQKVVFSYEKERSCVDMICSILAGYVWDEKNPLAAKHEQGLQSIAALCESSPLS